METFTIRCDRCGKPVPGGDIDRSLALAHCPSCDHVFEYGAALVGAPRPVPEPPASVTVAESHSELVVTWRWASARWVALAIFSVVWDVLLLVFAASVTAGGHPPAFLALHAAAGVLMTYGAAAGLLNLTTFTLSRGRMVVAHGPIPWPGGLEVPLSEVKQLSCRRVVRKTKNGEQITYTLDVSLNGYSQPLLKGIPDLAVAHWLERKIEAHLRIADAPVPGEVPK
jgi:hypothetical protein